jgi:2-polyprenyl-3-methyl-5-hydroxy-6-metoxy-1,4-benzoquinol methylase
MTKQVRQFFDRRATTFDSIYLNERLHTRTFNLLLRKAIYTRYEIAMRESGDVTGKSVLDVGCGSGRYCIEYAKRGAQPVVGVDLAPGMLDIARALAAQEGVVDRCRFVEVDFMSFQPPQSFDVVLAMGVFDYITDAVPFLERMVSVSCGLVLASFPGKNRMRMHLRSPRYRIQNCPLHFYTESELHKLSTAAGLKSYSLQFIPHSGTGFVLVGRTR